MTKLIQPLSTMVPIVDDDGKPTAQFARTLQRLAVSSNLSVTNGKIDVAAIATHMILANKTAGSATPTACSISDILDFLTTTRGSILFRGASGWQALAPGTANQVLQTNGPGADPTWATASGGGAATPTVRNTRTTAVSAAASVVATFPTGTVAGDVVIAIVTQDNACTTPTGWSSLDNQSGSWIGGMVCAKVMTASDIVTGSVTISFSGSGNGAVCMISVVGTTMNGIGGFLAQRAGAGSGSGVSSLVMTQIAELVTDLVIVFTGNRANSTNTVSNCMAYSTLNTNQSVFFGTKTTQTKFGFNETASFSVAGTGYYVVVLAIR